MRDIGADLLMHTNKNPEAANALDHPSPEQTHRLAILNSASTLSVDSHSRCTAPSPPTHTQLSPQITGGTR